MFEFSNLVEQKNNRKGSKISFLYKAPTLTIQKKFTGDPQETPEKDLKSRVKQKESINSAKTERKAETRDNSSLKKGKVRI